MQKVVTFGCRLNFYESDLIKNQLEDVKDSDIVVINTCAVTNQAEKQVKQTIRKINRQDPKKKIVVVGCAAQLDPKSYAGMQGVFKVLGNIEKLDKKNYQSEQKVLVGDISKVKDQPNFAVTQFTQRSRAFLQIQNGCDHDCTFCAITTARGNNRSIPQDLLISEIKKMVSKGFNEVVLTGVDITDYGKDIFGKPSLSLLLKKILDQVKELPRLRLSSIDVAETDDLLLSLMQEEERLMPHLHISLQSGDPIILKRMKRRHTPDQVHEFCQKCSGLKRNIAFGADIIAGFPTETEEMFDSTYRLLKDIKIPFLHVFPFSAKHGTKAALMPQIPQNLRKQRAKELIKLGKKNLQSFYQQQVGSIHSAILEDASNSIARSQNFCLVKVNNLKKPKAGQILSAKIIAAEDEYLIGQEIEV